MKHEKPILIYNVYIDGKRLKMNRKTYKNFIEPLRISLKQKYKAKTVYFNYRERLKN